MEAAHCIGADRGSGGLILRWLLSRASYSLANPMADDKVDDLLALTSVRIDSRRPPIKQLTCRPCSSGPALANSFSNLSW